MKISSGSRIIDELLDGGFESEVITTLYGAAGSGKSNIAMLAALDVASSGTKVVFVDTEGSFSIERSKQIKGHVCSDITNNIIFFKPTTFKDQRKHFNEIQKLVEKEKIGMIVVDSIVMLYRLERADEDKISKTNSELARQLSILGDVARKKNIPVVVTNQVYADFQSKQPNGIRMVGGDLLKYWSKCIIKLETIENSVRKATIHKHRSLPEGKSAIFEIVDKGLEEPTHRRKRFSLFH